MADAAPDVLADLLVIASEAGPERLVEADQLLRDLAGEELVGAAHRTWTARLREGLTPAGSPAGVPATPEDTFDMIRRLRATRPAGLP